MALSKFFGIPFATSGDKATIPEAVQPSGAISFTQGFGPDYERDPATDPLAKRVPRDETNELYFQITNAIRALQLLGVPEWFDVDDAGNDVSYPIAARVRHNDIVWSSTSAANTSEPGVANWTRDDAFSVAALEASVAEVVAGTLATKLITPRRLAAGVQRSAWLYGTQAGTAGAATLTLAPAITAYEAGQVYRFVATANFTAGATINVNGLGAQGIGRSDGTGIALGDIRTGDIVVLLHNGTRPCMVGLTRSQAASASLLPQTTNRYTTVGSTNFVVPTGVTSIFARAWGGGGGGGHATTAAARQGAPSGGAAGGYAERRFPVSPGDVVAIVVGAGGAGGSSSPAQPGQTGGNTTVTVNGVVMSALGGAGGKNVTAPGTVADGAVGGGHTNADFGIGGGWGNIGVATNSATPPALGGGGGAAPLGGSGFSLGGAGTPGAGRAPGGGGDSTSDFNFAGAAGARGEVQISFVAA